LYKNLTNWCTKLDDAILESDFATRVRELEIGVVLTRTTESRAVRAKMSAHETVEGQASSTAALILAITSKPRSEFTLAAASCSLPLSKTEPSQP